MDVSASRSIDTDVDFISSVVSRAVNNGTFGDATLVSITIVNNPPDFHVVSRVFFVNFELKEGKTGKIVDKSTVIKSKRGSIFDCVNGAPHLLESLFQREVTTYRDILPIVEKDVQNILCKMYYYEFSGIKDNTDAIVFENLRSLGYSVSTEHFIEDSHTASLLFRKFGQFHGAGYKTKMANSGLEKFFKSRLIPSRYLLDSCVEPAFTLLEILPHIMTPREKDLIEKFIDVVKPYSSHRIIMALIRPEEPFATICHGDLQLSNVLFKNDEHNRPVELKFVDLQTCYYGDPAFDLIFTLYTSVTPNLRRSYWNDLLQDYWSGLTAVARPDPGFTFDQFKVNLRQKAMSGLIECCNYLPLLMRGGSLSLVEIRQLRNYEHISRIPGAVDNIRDIMTHFIENDYMESFLSHFPGIEM